MPVQSPPTKKSSIVHRSESLRSEVSDASQQSKRVSFNRDVHVKRIPRGSAVVDRDGKLVAVLDGVGSSKHSDSSNSSPQGRLWVNSLASSKEVLPEEELLREAESILKHVDSVTCSASGDTRHQHHQHDHPHHRSLERSKSIGGGGSSSGVNGSSNGSAPGGLGGGGGSKGSHNRKPMVKALQKSPSKLSDFFTRTLPSQIIIKSKSQSPPLTKSTQNLATSGTSGLSDYPHVNGYSNSSHKNHKKPLVTRSSATSDLAQLNGSISKSEPNLFHNTNHHHHHPSSHGDHRYKKVAKIKKPHGTRVALNSIGDTPTNSSRSSGSGSGSDKDSLPNKVSTSESPVSSLSGPEEPSMAKSLARDYGNNHHSGNSSGSNNNHKKNPQTVSSIVQQFSKRRGGQESPERNFSNTPILSPSGGNTHNNNQPFSYIGGNLKGNNNTSGGNSSALLSDRGRSPSKSTTPSSSAAPGKPFLTSPKEVIYAQVVVSGKPGEPGVPGEKRTVHTTVTNDPTGNRTSPLRTSLLKSLSNASPNNNSNNHFNNHNNNSELNDTPSSLSPNSIQHFVYDYKDPSETSKPRSSSHNNSNSNHNSGHRMNDNNSNSSSSFLRNYRRAYDDFDFSGAKPRNNVTTVLLNNVDDDDLSMNSGSRNHSGSNNYHSNYRHPSPSPSPNFRKPEQSFYFGNLKNDSHAINSSSNNHNHVSSSSYNYRKSPRSNDYSSSREVSPINKSFSSAFLVRDAERKKDSILPSAKLVSAFGNPGGSSTTHRTNYDYLNDKLDDSHRHPSPSPIRHSRSTPRESPVRNPSKVSYSNSIDNMSKSRYGGHNETSTTTTSTNRYDRPSTTYDANKPTKKLRIHAGSKTSTPNASNSSVNKLGLRSKENSPAPIGRDYGKSVSPGKSSLRREDNSLERKYNRKNKDEPLPSTNPAPKNNNTSSGGGGGLISTLMRRNKDKNKTPKDVPKENGSKNEPPTPVSNNNKAVDNNNVNKENKIKRQRAKFLSAFLDKNFSSKKNTSSNSNNNANTVAEKQSDGKNTKPTDSEIEEAERRRDGEYQSWSSGDDEYRFGHHRNGQLTRGKSYNFGDLNEESSTKPWYDQNDSDYRREMATSRYNSATLGRPGMRSSGQDSSDVHRSKSLDRRAYRNRSPPRIVVTPNTPAVDETDKWKSTYDPIIRTFDRDRAIGNHQPPSHFHHSTLSKKMSGLSKSSYELDEHAEDRHLHSSGNGIGSRGSSKLRYFGDTDAEDVNYHHHHNNNSSTNNNNSYLGPSYSGSRYIPRTTSYLSKGRDNYSKYYTVPGSSLNSSGSENGSRMSKGSSNAGSQRSVYLHAPAVADIPPTGLQRRTLSRDELSNYSGAQKQTRHLARSMSVLAPWRPRHYREKYELTYNNNDAKENQPYGRPPKPPRSPTRKSMSPSPGRAGSTESLLKLSEDKTLASGGKNTLGKSSTLSRKKENVNISRSKSMPKDTRFAGWLRRRRFMKDGKEGKA